MKKRILSLLLSLILLISLVPVSALRVSAASRTTSEKAIEILKQIEGFHAEAYEDNGQWSIGYGTAANKGDTITRDAADKAMRVHLKSIDKAIGTLSTTARREFTQNEHDALALFSYNCGTAWITANGRFRQSVINNDKGNDFLYNICLWANVGGKPSTGLLNRRLAEANLYLNGVYSRTAPANYTYTLLDANGGSVGEELAHGYNKNVPVAIHTVPSLKGSRFLGWYTQKEGGEYVTILDASTAGKTLYAHWQAEDGGVQGGKVTGTPASYSLSAAQAASLKVYETPDTNAKVTKTLLKTATLNVTAEYIDGENVKWVKLKEGGWVSLGNVEKPVILLDNVIVTVTGDSVNIREKAGASAYIKVIKRVSKGEKLTITQIKTVNGARWGQCEEGWIALMYTDYDDVIQEESESTGESNTIVATGTVACTSVLKIRSGAGTTNRQVGTITNGTKVAIYEIKLVRGSKWGRINAGWICLDYVVIDAKIEEVPEEDKKPSTSEKVVATGTVTHTHVNYRSGAGTTYTLKGQLPNGAKLSIYEIKTVNGHDWGRFDNGWVCLDYVTLDKQPVVDKEETPDKENTTDKEEKPDKEETTDKEDTSEYLMAITTAQLVVYDENGNKTSKVISQNKTVKIHALGTFEDGTEIYAQVDEGYVLAKYLNIAINNVKYEVTAKAKIHSTADGPETGRTLPKGEIVTVIAMRILDNSVWVYVTEAGGWVNAQLLKNAGSDQQKPPQETKPEETEPEETVPEETKPEETKPSDKEEDKDDGKEETKPSGGKSGVIFGADVVNVRSSAGVRYDNLATTLKRGTKVTVYEVISKDDAQWGRIDQGWICMKYVNLNATGSGNTSGGGSNGATGYATGFVHSEVNLNVRSGPGTHHSKVGTLKYGDEVRVYEQELRNGMVWGRIDQGWVCMSYVTLIATGGSTGTTGSTAGSVMGTIARCFYAVNVRNAPGTGSALVGKILVGSRVEIYEQKKHGNTMWGRVNQGWISMDYVLLDSELPPEGDIGANAGTGSTGNSGGTTQPDTKPAPAGAVYTGSVIGTSQLKVRSSASTKATINGTLKRGAEVVIYETVIAEYMAWGRCDSGWICLVYVDLEPCDPNAVDARVVQTIDTAVRSGAGTKYEKVDTLAKGTVIKIYETDGDWFLTDGGWVSRYNLLA